MATVINFLKKKETVEEKKAFIFTFILNYYKELNKTGLNIPYFLEARNKYNELIKNIKDVNIWYKKIKEYIETI